MFLYKFYFLTLFYIMNEFYTLKILKHNIQYFTLI